MSWQEELGAQARAYLEREASRPPLWVVRATDPPEFSNVWARRYTRESYDAGERVAEDLSLMATCYERRISASFRTCEDGVHSLCEFLPPVDSLCVRADRMSGVVAALRRSGYHASCSGPGGKRYEF